MSVISCTIGSFFNYRMSISFKFLVIVLSPFIGSLVMILTIISQGPLLWKGIVEWHREHILKKSTEYAHKRNKRKNE